MDSCLNLFHIFNFSTLGWTLLKPLLKWDLHPLLMWPISQRASFKFESFSHKFQVALAGQANWNESGDSKANKLAHNKVARAPGPQLRIPHCSTGVHKINFNLMGFDVGHLTFTTPSNLQFKHKWYIESGLALSGACNCGSCDYCNNFVISGGPKMENPPHRTRRAQFSVPNREREQEIQEGPCAQLTFFCGGVPMLPATCCQQHASRPAVASAS